jgi:hypothetical protein
VVLGARQLRSTIDWGPRVHGREAELQRPVDAALLAVHRTGFGVEEEWDLFF